MSGKRKIGFFSAAGLTVTFTVSLYVWLSCFRLWRAFGLGTAPYFILQTALFANMLFCLHSSGRLPDNPLGRILLFCASCYFIILFYSAPFFFVRDAAAFMALRIAPGTATAFFLNAPASGTAVLAAAVLLAAACYINMGIIRITHYAVPVKKRGGRELLRIVMIADAHVGNGLATTALEKTVDTINAQNPDLILLLGDIFDENTPASAMEKTRSAFSRFKATYGAYGVLGNHERYIGSRADAYFEGAHIKILSDEAAEIGGDIILAGRKDMTQHPAGLNSFLPDGRQNKAVIVMSHQPQNLAEAARAGADIALCGHTHGGQFPFMYPLCAYVNDMVRGKKIFSGMTAVTSAGLGGWGLHAKLPAKSEIVVIDVTFDA